MSYSATFSTQGLKNKLCVEYIGEAFSIEISIQDDMGKRKQFVRIPLDDFSYEDRVMFASFIQANICNSDQSEIDMDEEDYLYDDEDDGVDDGGLV